MHFHVSFTLSTEHRSGAEARFLETGAMPPEGVTLVSRWHDVGARQGYMVVEATDYTAVASFLREWTDLLTFDVRPVISDEQLAQIMSQ